MAPSSLDKQFQYHHSLVVLFQIFKKINSSYQFIPKARQIFLGLLVYDEVSDCWNERLVRSLDNSLGSFNPWQFGVKASWGNRLIILLTLGRWSFIQRPLLSNEAVLPFYD
jgi:hypothetical protein